MNIVKRFIFCPYSFTAGEPMITYHSTGSYVNGYYNTGQTLRAVGDNVQASGPDATTGRRYAVAAYIIPGI
jgi:hypothetical protein